MIKKDSHILFYEKNCEWSKTKTFLWEILVIPYSDDSLFCVHYSIFIKAWVLTPGTRTDPNLDPDWDFKLGQRSILIQMQIKNLCCFLFLFCILRQVQITYSSEVNKVT